MKKRIILATGSPTRKNINEKLGLNFEIIPSKYEEDMALDLPPEKLAMELAYGKANDIAKDHHEEIIIGIDTFVVFEGKTIGKPKDKEDAINILKKLSGKMHEVFSGIAIIDCENKKIIKDFEVTKVKFRKLDNSEIINYVNSLEPLNKAGAYGVQGKGGILVEKFDGCFYNVEGFPVSKILSLLKKINIDYF